MAHSVENSYCFLPATDLFAMERPIPTGHKIEAGHGADPPQPGAARRKLAVILSADVKEFGRRMEADEEGTLRTLLAYRAMMDQFIVRHGGRIVGTAGDSVLAEFSSPVEAARCASEIQDELAKRNSSIPRDRRLEFRVGINLGDVIVEGTDLFGDGVNVAARLQALAEAGGILVSGGVYDQIKSKLPFGYDFLGEQKVKNLTEPVRIYRVHQDPARSRRATRAGWRRWRSLAVVVLIALAAGVAIWRADPSLAPRLLGPIASSGPLRTPAQASIAVLPFADQSSGQSNEYFSDGISEDLVSALGRFSNVSIASWSAVARYKGAVVSPAQLQRELGVRYVVDGNVRRAGSRVRVTVRLSETENGTLLWSQQYDEPVDDIFTLQDRIVRHIVSAMSIRVTYLEQERALAKTTKNLSAYDEYLRGRQVFRETTNSANLRSRGFFEKAIELDPNYADAIAMLAWTYSKAADLGWTERPHKALEQAHDLAQAALRLNPSNELAHVLLAVNYTYRRQFDLALSELQHAAKANPNYGGENYADRGWVLLLAGRSGEAISVLEDALRVDPHPVPGAFFTLGLAYYLNERYGDAVAILEAAIGRHPQHRSLYVALAASYGETERLDHAKRVAANLRSLDPFFEVDRFGEAFRDPADRKRIQDGLRKAGL